MEKIKILKARLKSIPLPKFCLDVMTGHLNEYVFVFFLPPNICRKLDPTLDSGICHNVVIRVIMINEDGKRAMMSVSQSCQVKAHGISPPVEMYYEDMRVVIENGLEDDQEKEKFLRLITRLKRKPGEKSQKSLLKKGHNLPLLQKLDLNPCGNTEFSEHDFIEEYTGGKFAFKPGAAMNWRGRDFLPPLENGKDFEIEYKSHPELDYCEPSSQDECEDEITAAVSKERYEIASPKLLAERKNGKQIIDGKRTEAQKAEAETDGLKFFAPELLDAAGNNILSGEAEEKLSAVKILNQAHLARSPRIGQSSEEHVQEDEIVQTVNALENSAMQKEELIPIFKISDHGKREEEKMGRRGNTDKEKLESFRFIMEKVIEARKVLKTKEIAAIRARMHNYRMSMNLTTWLEKNGLEQWKYLFRIKGAAAPKADAIKKAKTVAAPVIFSAKPIAEEVPFDQSVRTIEVQLLPEQWQMLIRELQGDGHLVRMAFSHDLKIAYPIIIGKGWDAREVLPLIKKKRDAIMSYEVMPLNRLIEDIANSTGNARD